MYTQRYETALLVLLVGAMGLASLDCRPKRLRDLSQKDDDRTEGQIVGEKHLRRADALFDGGDSVGAQKEYLEALTHDPMQFKAHLGLGDVYEIEDDLRAAVCEFVAHTELAPKPKHYLDRMFTYVFSKFARNPSSKNQLPDKKRAKALLALSRAVSLNRQGKSDAALAKLDEVVRDLPGSGIAEYYQASVHLARGRADEAAAALERAIRKNPYFARRVLTDHEEKHIPGLLDRLDRVLAQELMAHPSDIETAFLLAVTRLRQGRDDLAVEAARKALAWGRPRWDVLLVKAAAHERLGQRVRMEQAFIDLKEIQPNISAIFTEYEPSVFHGMLMGTITDLARDKFTPVVDEPARSYFLWRLLEERGDAQAVEHRERFRQTMQAGFPAGEFDNLPSTQPVEQEPTTTAEFMGQVQSRIAAGMVVLQRCDVSRRPKRARPTGRVILRVALARDGKVGQLTVEENTTEDPWLAYCMVRKLMDMRFPKPLRATEAFKLPVLVGPEVDALQEKKPAPPGS